MSASPAWIAVSKACHFAGVLAESRSMRNTRASGKRSCSVVSRRWVPRPKGWMSWLPQSGQAPGMAASSPQWWQRRRLSARCTTRLAAQRRQREIQPQAVQASTGA
jgi:hypothetical protein